MKKFKTRYVVHVPPLAFHDKEKAHAMAKALNGTIEKVKEPTQQNRIHALYLFDFDKQTHFDKEDSYDA